MLRLFENAQRKMERHATEMCMDVHQDIKDSYINTSPAEHVIDPKVAFFSLETAAFDHFTSALPAEPEKRSAMSGLMSLVARRAK